MSETAGTLENPIVSDFLWCEEGADGQKTFYTNRDGLSAVNKSSAITSDSEQTVATSKAVKLVNDKATAATSTANAANQAATQATQTLTQLAAKLNLTEYDGEIVEGD